MLFLVHARVNSRALRTAKYCALFIFMPCSASLLAQPSEGVLIYSRPVPTQPAQFRGEPAPPDQVALTGPDSAWGNSATALEVISDSEAALIGSPLARGLAVLADSRDQFSIFGEAGLSQGPAALSGGQGAGQVGSALAPMLGTLAISGQTIGSAVSAATGAGGQ